MKGKRGWRLAAVLVVVGCGGGGQARDGSPVVSDAQADAQADARDGGAGGTGGADAAPAAGGAGGAGVDAANDRPDAPGGDAPDASNAASDGGGDGPPLAVCQPGGRWFDLPYLARTAAYSRALDALLILPTTQRALRIVDPETCSDRTVALPRLGSSLALAPSGRSVAVGHDGSVSIVDLQTFTVQATFPTRRPASEIGFDANGRVQLFTRSELSVPLETIDATSGALRLGTINNLGGDGHLRITPDGQSLYWLADETTTSGSIQRVDLETGALGIDRSRLGELAVCHDLFPGDDSKLLFTACGTVVRTSATDATQDLTFQGTLEGLPSILHLDSLAAKGVIVAIPKPPLSGTRDVSQRIQVNETSYFNRVKTIPLPTLNDGASTSSPPLGRFVFIRSDGLHYYVIARRGAASGGLGADGVARIDASDPGGDAGMPAVPVPGTGGSSRGLPTALALPRAQAMLDFQVADAAYSRTLNRVVATSTKPTVAVKLVDPDSGAADTIATPAQPSSVFVDAEGRTAAVLRSGGVTFIDLVGRTVLREREIPSKHVAFVSPTRVLVDDGTNGGISWLDLGTGIATPAFSSSFSSYGVGAVPGTSTFYTSTAGDGRLTRHDQTAVFSGDPYFPLDLLQLPSSNLFSCGTAFQIAGDGSSAILDCGGVIKLAAAKADDLVYAGSLELTPSVSQSVYAPASHRFYVLPATLQGSDSIYAGLAQIAVYDDRWLNLLALIDPGTFPGTTVVGQLQRLFVGAPSGLLYALAQNYDPSGVANTYAIYRFDVSGL
jgi:hypothetical protein